jgi:hypothetical protein
VYHQGTAISVQIGYGQGIAPYAAIVHFTPDPPVHHPQGQAYYLQQPLFAATAGFAVRLADALRGAFG